MRIVLLVLVFVVVPTSLVVAMVWHKADIQAPLEVIHPDPHEEFRLFLVSHTPTTTTTAPPKPRPAPRASRRPPNLERSGVCGGDLPPCWVLARESGGDPRIWNGRCYMPVGSLGQCGRSSASGLWQFLRSTWAGFGGFVNAADAPVDVQNEKARLVWAGGRGCRHWNACAAA